MVFTQFETKKTITAQKTVPAVHRSQQPISPQSLPEALVLPSQHVAGFLNHNGYSLLCAFETLLSVIDSTAATPHNRKPHEVRECGKTCPPLEIRKGTGLFAQKMCTASFLQLISKKKSLNLHHMRNKPYRHMDAWLLMACFNLVDIAQMSSGFNRDNPL